MNKLVDKKMRVFIKYDKERIKEIIDKLISLGACKPEIDLPFVDYKETIISINEHKDIVIYTSSMPEYPFIKEYYKEIVLPFKPKDKQIVWCWDWDEDVYRIAGFYDAINDCSFTYKGERNGMRYRRYAPYNGPIEPWMEKALSKIK